MDDSICVKRHGGRLVEPFLPAALCLIGQKATEAMEAVWQNGWRESTGV